MATRVDTSPSIKSMAEILAQLLRRESGGVDTVWQLGCLHQAVRVETELHRIWGATEDLLEHSDHLKAMI